MLSACSPAPQQAPASQLAAGEEVFNTSCANCHYDGSGDATRPALTESTVVRGPVAGFVDVVLHGQKGRSVFNGKLIQGVMPAQDSLSDQEIADVITYVRAQFGKQPGVVTPAEVAAQRKK